MDHPHDIRRGRCDRELFAQSCLQMDLVLVVEFLSSLFHGKSDLIPSPSPSGPGPISAPHQVGLVALEDVGPAEAETVILPRTPD